MGNRLNKQYTSGLILLGAAILLATAHIFSPFSNYPLSWLITIGPIVIVTAVTLLGCRRKNCCMDVSAVVFGIIYGVLLAAFAAAVLLRLSLMLSPWYAQHPLDEIASYIIMAVSAIAGFLALYIEYRNVGEELFSWRTLLELCIAGSVALALFMPFLQIMEFFEGILSILVK